MKATVMLLLLSAATRAAAQPALTRDDSGVTVRATRITAPMKIDGRLDERVYEEVPAITEYIQQEPRGGEPITERTESWVLFDDTNLYIACRCWDTHPGLERRLAGENQPVPRRVDGGDGHSVQVAPLWPRARADLGHQSPPDDSRKE